MKINHIALYTPDLERMRVSDNNFAENVLGFLGEMVNKQARCRYMIDAGRF